MSFQRGTKIAELSRGHILKGHLTATDDVAGYQRDQNEHEQNEGASGLYSKREEQVQEVGRTAQKQLETIQGNSKKTQQSKWENEQHHKQTLRSYILGNIRISQIPLIVNDSHEDKHPKAKKIDAKPQGEANRKGGFEFSFRQFSRFVAHVCNVEPGMSSDKTRKTLVTSCSLREPGQHRHACRCRATEPRSAVIDRRYREALCQ